MLKLQANPTFKVKVGIPVPGEDKRPVVTFVFKHMGKTEFDAFNPTSNDAETLMRICAGWEGIEEEFSQENLAKLCDAYPGSAFVIAETYAKELHGGRLGN